MKENDTVGKCEHCDDPIYRFQAVAHDGCARLAGIKKAMEVIQSKFKREVIPSGSKRYSADVVEFLNSMNSAYLMIAKEDWRKVKEWGIEGKA